jgi:hypothetical protein
VCVRGTSVDVQYVREGKGLVGLKLIKHCAARIGTMREAAANQRRAHLARINILAVAL